jgi:tetratricopeptide (TPR) repeat protein
MTTTIRRHLGIALLLAAAGGALYANTLQVPWYFDDWDNIVNNETVADLGLAWERAFTSARGLSFLSFALNYRLHGLAPTGFHLVNILIHVGCALLVYALLRRLYPDSLLWPAAGALLFVAHPLQTQAVTYTVQRMTSLGCLFLLAAILAYLQARRRRRDGASFGEPRHLAWYLAATGCGVLAVFAKENAVVLPLLLVLIEAFVPGGEPPRWRRLPYLLPFLALPLLMAGVMAGTKGSALEVMQRGGIEYFELPAGASHSVATLEPENLRLRYLATELVVFWVYVKLLLWPAGQALDYSYPLVERVANLKSQLALAGLAAAFALAWRGRRRRPLVLFGLLWIAIALSTESTFFPLDPLFEHRLYVPMVGVAVLAVEILFKPLPGRWRIPALALVVAVLGALTVSRNALWNRPLDFWADNVARVPHSYRPLVNLGLEQFNAKNYDEARRLTVEAIRIGPADATLHKILAEIQVKQGLLEEARRSYQTAIALSNEPGELYAKLGVLYFQQKRYAEGIPWLERGVAVAPEDENLAMNLGYAYYEMGDGARAESLYRRALAINPRYLKARFGLGYILFREGRLAEALEELEQARQLAPRDVNTLYYYALAASALGRTREAEGAAGELGRLDPAKFEQLRTQLEGGRAG